MNYMKNLLAAVMIARANKLFDKVKAGDVNLKEFSDGGEVPDWAKSAL